MSEIKKKLSEELREQHEMAVEGDTYVDEDDMYLYACRAATLEAKLHAAEAERDALRQRLQDEYLADKLPPKETAGCGDNSCLIEKPKGIGTNGGCRCTRPAFKAALQLMRKERDDLEREANQLALNLSASCDDHKECMTERDALKAANERASETIRKFEVEKVSSHD